jgi:hypothetical protein
MGCPIHGRHVDWNGSIARIAVPLHGSTLRIKRVPGICLPFRVRLQSARSMMQIQGMLVP